MKQIVLTLLVLILISAGSVPGFQGSSEWIKYDSAEGHYTVELPTQPKLKTQEAVNASGEKFQQYMASASDPNAVFLVGYFDYAPGTAFSLDKARDGMVQAVKGTLLSEGSISLEGSPGRELKVSATGPDGVEYLVQARFYDMGKRVYVLQFIIAKAYDSASTAKAARYFESFKVTP
ncbi:MAG TPA: hypothetical protein VN920_00230 [Pyrinomonadaceae bacterium]|nr:hypothetical protein [Pyrinomonadaceae bacterium]